MGAEEGKADAVDLAQHLQHMPQARFLVARQVNLGDVAGDYGLGPKADAGQEHLDLLDRGVLRLVENDEGVVERAPPHERQRGDLDDVALDQLGHPFEPQHFIECVVERAQVGVHLLRHVAGQEAQLFAGLDRRPCQNQPPHLVAL